MHQSQRAKPHQLATGRPSIKGNRRKHPPTHQRTFFSYKKRLHIINWRRQHSMESAINTFFMGVEGKAKKTAWKRILRWETQRARIEAAVSDPATANKRTDRAKGIATTLSFEDEENIAIWVAQLRADGVPISNLMLKCKALEIARDVGLSLNDFKASPTWIF
ncbi:hypothetical protein AeRB84_017864 [Aphanomyces euteiches]|nr:hypothetical protein AeRB84_017864 [Aphanomyces euteiches]